MWSWTVDWWIHSKKVPDFIPRGIKNMGNSSHVCLGFLQALLFPIRPKHMQMWAAGVCTLWGLETFTQCELQISTSRLMWHCWIIIIWEENISSVDICLLSSDLVSRLCFPTAAVIQLSIIPKLVACVSIFYLCDTEGAAICHPPMRCRGKCSTGFGLKGGDMWSLNQQVRSFKINPFLCLFTGSQVFPIYWSSTFQSMCYRDHSLGKSFIMQVYHSVTLTSFHWRFDLPSQF